MKRTLLLALLALILLLAACAPTALPTTSGTTAPPATAAPTQPTTEPTTQPTTVPVAELSPTFENLPQMYSDLAEVYPAEHFVLFAFITAGMDVSDTTIISYDLQTDTLLGQLSLGEDLCKIFPLENNCFAVLSLYSATYRVYDSACSLLSEAALEGITGEIGIAGLQGDVLLISQLLTGEVLLYDLQAQSALKTDLQPDVYEYVGVAGDGFLLESYTDGLILLSMDGTSAPFFRNATAEVVGSTWAAGIRGDYVTLLPLSGGDPVMAPCQISGEMFVAADGAGILSRSQNWDSTDSLYYYATGSMTVATAAVHGQIVGAGLAGEQAVAVIRKDYSQPLEFVYVDFSQYDAVAVGKAAYDNAVLNGGEPLPEPAGSDETVALIERIQSEYGVRLMYEPDIFDLGPLGYTLTTTNEELFREKALLLEQFFQFLPDGLLAEMSEKAPMVIYLCEDVHPTAGGMHTFLKGWNVVFLSVNGNDDYFLSVAAHEMGHALELGMDIVTVSGWRQLMPEGIRDAYENLSLTVEYTPDDHGRTPVWFLEAYSRTSEKEDRAVLFAALFDAWRTGDYSRLQYEGLQAKAAYWAEMLRAAYDSCADVTFPWETMM